MIDSGSHLFLSEFRNCMMHYNLDNKDNVIILEKYYNVNEPFYGLVESCFEGQLFIEFSTKSTQYILELKKYLLSWFYINMRKVKWDL